MLSVDILPFQLVLTASEYSPSERAQIWVCGRAERDPQISSWSSSARKAALATTTFCYSIVSLWHKARPHPPFWPSSWSSRSQEPIKAWLFRFYWQMGINQCQGFYREYTIGFLMRTWYCLASVHGFICPMFMSSYHKVNQMAEVGWNGLLWNRLWTKWQVVRCSQVLQEINWSLVMSLGFDLKRTEYLGELSLSELENAISNWSLRTFHFHWRKWKQISYWSSNLFKTCSHLHL